MTTTKTTTYELPIPPLGATGTADGYGTLLQTAENNIIAAVTGAKNIAGIATATGTNTITATYAPAVTLTAGTRVILVAAGANTGAATFQPNSLTVKDIKKYVSTALVAGDIPAAGYPCDLEYNGTAWVLINPSVETRLGGAGAPSSTEIGFLVGVTGSIQDQFDLYDTAVNTGIPADILQGTYIYETSGGSANAYTLTLTPPLASMAAGTKVRIYVHAANTGDSTLAVSGLAVTNIKKRSSAGTLVAINAGDMPLHQIAELVYDGTVWELLNPTPSGGDLASFPASGAYVAYGQTETVLTAYSPAPAKYDMVYVNSAGTVQKVITSSTPQVCIGMCVVAGTPPTIMSSGLITYSSWNFTKGAQLYIAETSGDLTTTCPSTAGVWTQAVGIALTATTVRIQLGPLVEVPT